ncbi:unnamed protein product [Toxocara canis]|uniref:Bestrophin homolog n=1 Tax=Toxocara canis TaxID=6265 RepID=A0A183VEC7_TOXCA|nr:unnamed protein product [Toxocara canis]
MYGSDRYSAVTSGMEVEFEKKDIVLTFSLPLTTLKARTSGVLLVVGVGSYMVYRMFVRLLGRNFMWTLVDQARVDTLSRSDVRLLHPARIVHGSDIEDFCSPVFADDEYSDSCSEECSPSRRRHLVSRSFRDRALTNVPTPLEKRNQRRQIHDEVDEVMR